MAERDTTTWQITWTQVLLVLILAAAAGCLLWEPLQVVAFICFLFLLVVVSAVSALIHKSLPVILATAMVLLYPLLVILGEEDLFFGTIVPWGVVIGGSLFLLMVLWVLLTTRGRTWWLDWRGLVAMQRGKYAKAEQLLRRSLEMREARYGTEHRSLAWSMTMLANLAHERGELEQVRLHAEHALGIQERLLPADHAEIRTTLNLLAAAQIGLGKYAEAEPIFRRLLAAVPAKPGMARLERSIFQHNLALCLMEQGDYVQAEELCRDSEDLLKQEPYLRLWGCKAYLRSLTAELCLKQQRPQEAWRVACDAVAQIEKQIAPYQVYRTVPLLRQGRVALAIDRPLDALENARTILAAQEAFFGPEHHFHVGTLLLLGQAYAQLDRYAEAEEAFRRALTLGEKKLPMHPRLAEILDDWGWMLLRQGKTHEAEPLLRRALEHRRRFLPDHHPDLATSLAHYAAALREKGQETEAQRHATESAQVRLRYEQQQHHIAE